MATIQEIGDNGPDGTRLGLSATTSYVAFWGATPVVQPTNASQSAVSTATITAVATTPVTGTYGFTTSAIGNAFIVAMNDTVTRAAALTTLVNRLRADLVTVGIIKGS
jgi:hypothetical protein